MGPKSRCCLAVHLSICRSTCPTGPDEWAGGWGLHAHPTNREGGGTSWWARVLWALIWVISGSPFGSAMWEGGILRPTESGVR